MLVVTLHVLRWYAFARWVEGDALNLPFPDSYFDAITMGYGLRNVVDREKAMSEMLRVVKSGSPCASAEYKFNLNPHVSLVITSASFFLFSSGSRVSVLDFNKSPQPLSSSFRVTFE